MNDYAIAALVWICGMAIAIYLDSISVRPPIRKDETP